MTLFLIGCGEGSVGIVKMLVDNGAKLTDLDQVRSYLNDYYLHNNEIYNYV